MFCTLALSLSAVCVQCPMWLFLQFLNFVLSRYVAQVLSEWFWNGSSPPIITGITFDFTFHMRWISNMRSLYSKIFSASFLITLLSIIIIIWHYSPLQTFASLMDFYQTAVFNASFQFLILHLFISICTQLYLLLFGRDTLFTNWNSVWFLVSSET